MCHCSSQKIFFSIPSLYPATSGCLSCFSGLDWASQAPCRGRPIHHLHPLLFSPFHLFFHLLLLPVLHHLPDEGIPGPCFSSHLPQRPLMLGPPQCCPAGFLQQVQKPDFKTKTYGYPATTLNMNKSEFN